MEETRKYLLMSLGYGGNPRITPAVSRIWGELLPGCCGKRKLFYVAIGKGKNQNCLLPSLHNGEE
jgi:hypothetical protein